MDITESVITHTGRFIEITFGVLDAAIEELIRYLATREEKRMLQEIVSFFKASDKEGRAGVYSYATQDFTYAEMKEGMRRYFKEDVLNNDGTTSKTNLPYVVKMGKVEKNGEYKNVPYVLIRNIDKSAFKRCMLEMAIQHARLTRLDTDSFITANKGGAVAVVKDLTKDEVTYLQECSKDSANTFFFTALKDEAKDAYSVYVPKAFKDRFDVALLTMKMEESLNAGQSARFAKIKAKNDVMDEVIGHDSLNDNFYVVSADDTKTFVHCDDNGVGVIKNGEHKLTFLKDDGSSKESERNLSRFIENRAYAIYSIKNPVLLTYDEWSSPDRNRLIEEKGKVYKAEQPLRPEDIVQAKTVVALQRLASQPKSPKKDGSDEHMLQDILDGTYQEELMSVFTPEELEDGAFTKAVQSINEAAEFKSQVAPFRKTELENYYTVDHRIAEGGRINPDEINEISHNPRADREV